MIPTPTLSLDSNLAVGYVVYGWRREESYLYIGMSTVGLRRLSGHHVIQIKDTFLKTDILDVWSCLGHREAIDLERELIELHKPKFNISMNPDNKQIKETEEVDWAIEEFNTLLLRSSWMEAQRLKKSRDIIIETIRKRGPLRKS
jgi:predicted GIY-YIG superfamily endonuclease